MTPPIAQTGDDIPALVERVYRECSDPCKARNVESGCTCAAVEAALRTLARPVEDEVRHAMRVCEVWADRADSGEPVPGSVLRRNASLLARLARERSLLEGKLCDRQATATELARERDTAIDNMRAGWSALRMIREAVEQQGVGLVAAGEHLDGPTAQHEAEAIVVGVLGLAREKASAEQEAARLRAGLVELAAASDGRRDESGSAQMIDAPYERAEARWWTALKAAIETGRALAAAAGAEEPR